MRGRAYEDDVVVTGLGKHLALPIVRERLVTGRQLTQAEASDAVSIIEMNHCSNNSYKFHLNLFLVTKMYGGIVLSRLSNYSTIQCGRC